MEPSSINMETVADKEHHGVVGADDQDQKNESRNHHSVCTRGDGGKHNLTLFVSDIFSNKATSWRSNLWGFSPSIPDQQPADIEAQIHTPAYEEPVRQHCRAAVNVAVTIPSKKKETLSHQCKVPTLHPGMRYILYETVVLTFCKVPTVCK